MSAMPDIDWTVPRSGHKLPATRDVREGRFQLLHEFLEAKREAIIARTKAKVLARTAPCPTEEELVHGIPMFFDQLIDTLKGYTPRDDEIKASAMKHGHEMLRLGFTVGQVVYDYGDVCQAVTELAFELDAQISIEEFHTLNRCLDDAIAQAVTEYGRLREQSLADQGTERLGALAHELRNRLSTAMLSFGILKGGSVAIGGSVGALLDRSLKGLNDLIDRSLVEIRLDSPARSRESFLVAEFIEEVEIGAILDAKVRGHQLTVEPVQYGVVIEADRQLLAAAVANLLQNAFKFTPQPGHVWLRTRVTDDVVSFDIEDECGGLRVGQADRLFQPFHQASVDRTGLGLGLSISRKAVNADGGEIRVRNLPNKGCIFTVELPRKIATIA